MNLPSSMHDSIAGRTGEDSRSPKKLRSKGHRPNQSRSKPKRSSMSSNSLRNRSNSRDGLYLPRNPMVVLSSVFLSDALLHR